MSLLSLPPELLAIVIGKLDTKSVYNLYEAGLVNLQGLVTECQLSANKLATAKTLNTNFFSAVSGHVRVLNLRGVPDLDLPLLLDALKNMNMLTDLNVMHTNINMVHFLQIVKVRPTLKSIAMYFIFSEKMSHINDEVLLEYQKAFEGFKDIHFVVPLQRDEHSALAVRMLERTNLRSLQLTSRWFGDLSYECLRLDNGLLNNMKMTTVSHFQFQVIQNFDGGRTFQLPTSTVMNFDEYEILIIETDPYEHTSSRYSVFATPLLKNVIFENFAVAVECLSDWPEVSAKQILERIEPIKYQKVAFMFWNRERNTFGENFHKYILAISKNYFVFSLKSGDSRPVPAEFKWYCVEATAQINSPTEFVRRLFRGLKPGGDFNPVVELDYGLAFKDKEDIKLDVMFKHCLPRRAVPKMINNYDFLNKITHLMLRGCKINYGLDFFNTLFAHCHKLVTLQVINGDNTEHLQFLSKSKSLKNILLFAHSLQFSALFAYLSGCRSLENVCLYDSSKIVPHSLPDPTDLFTKCSNLYNVVIMGHMSRSTCEELRTRYNNVRSDLGKESLNLKISHFEYGYTHPYDDVFDTFRLKPM